MAVDIGDSFILGFGKQTIGNPAQVNYQELHNIITIIVKNLFYIAGLILFIFIIIGGVGMIINAGNAEKQKQSSQTLSSAITGFLIIFVSYWLVRIIQVITGIEIFFIP